MLTSEKLLDLSEIPAWRARLRRARVRLAVTNGCFDLLHLGHVTYLQRARSFASVLLVGVNGDESVRALKGPTRPINSERDRALVLAALEAVSAVVIFPEVTATRFLELAAPDVYVKGGDYTLDTLNPEEKAAVLNGKGRIELVPMVPGKSTTSTLARLADH